MPVNARIYCRISEVRRRDGRVETLGVDRQEPPCRQLVARKGWGVAGVYVDNDLSAYSGRRRPAYERLLAETRADLAAGQPAAIVAWDADRLTRRPVEAEGLIDLAERLGVQLGTVTGEYDLGTASGRLHFRMRGAVARYESEHKAERVALWHDQRAEAGQWHGGRAPLGYRYAESGGLEVDQAQAAEIRHAYARILQGASRAAVCREWRERGVMRSAGGRPIGVTQLGKLLRSPHLAGIRVHRGERRPGAWPAIVSEAEQEAVAAVLDDRAFHQRRAVRALLSGLIFCGREGCGKPMRGAPVTGRGGVRKPGYRCHAQAGGCGRVHRLAKPIDDFVRDAVISALAGRALARERAERRAAAGNARIRAAREAIKADRALLRKRRDELADEVIDAADFAHVKRRIEARIEQARQQLAATVTDRALAGLPSTKAGLKAAWKGWSDDRRREVIAAVIERIDVLPVGRGVRFDGRKHLDIDWKA
jgi:site-specific DNA recombinase